MTGENTDLKYTFEDGWSVEVHGLRRTGSSEERHHAFFSVINPSNEEVYEGEMAVRPSNFIDPPNFYTTLCGVIYTLKQDMRRIKQPYRYSEVSDRGILLGVDERLRLWLSTSEDAVFDTALNELAGTNRRGRIYWENAVWTRAVSIG